MKKTSMAKNCYYRLSYFLLYHMTLQCNLINSGLQLMTEKELLDHKQFCDPPY